jgi:dTDP-4-amino-4,6-dideoxygalactose transaminase
MLTGPSDLLEEARTWSLHGMTRDAWRRNETGSSFAYDVTRAGFKYNMTDIQAAIGRVQLGRLDGMHARRREIASRYSAALGSSESLEIPIERPGYSHAWHIYAVRLRLEQLTIDRARFASEMQDCGIGTSVHFMPVHLFSYYENRYGYAPSDFPLATAEYERLVSLPIHSRMTDDDVDDVVDAVTTVLGRHRR